MYPPGVRPRILFVAVGLALAACTSSNPAPSPAGPPTGPATGGPAVTAGTPSGPARTTGPGETPVGPPSESTGATPSAAGPSGSPAAVDVDRLLTAIPLPRQVGGRQLRFAGAEGDGIFAFDQTGALRGFLDGFASPADTALLAGATEDRRIAVVGVRVRGTDAPTLATRYLSAARAAAPGATATEQTIAGKAVQRLSSSVAEFYLYAAGDVLYTVVADEASASEVFSQLP